LPRACRSRPKKNRARNDPDAVRKSLRGLTYSSDAAAPTSSKSSAISNSA
jgi:hypothetical protein